MKKIIFLSLLICMGWAGCQKSNLPAPIHSKTDSLSSTGGISATISPTGAATRVIITGMDKSGANRTFVADPDGLGNFNFVNIPAGLYTFQFFTTSDFNVLIGKQVELIAGKVTALGKITFSVKEPGGFHGVINPVGAVSSVTASATIEAMPISYNATPDQEGRFAFLGLPTATYTLSYTVDPKYLQPQLRYANVTKGQDLDVGNIAIAKVTDCGSVVGKLVPAGLASKVMLGSTPSNGYAFEAEVDPQSGAFKFPQVPNGSYLLRCLSVSGQISPPNKTITVTQGAFLDVGTLAYTPNVLESSVSCKVNGVAAQWLKFTNSYGIRLTATYQNKELVIICNTGGAMIGNTGKLLRISLDEVEGPGTYICKGTTTSFIGFADRTSSYSTWPNYTTINGGSGKVTITAIDEVQRTISGNFSATLASAQASMPLRELSNGLFKVSY